MKDLMKDSILELSQALGDKLTHTGNVLATAESCTGGGIATAVTDIAGSSQWFDRGFITYSNESKMEMLGVSQQTLDQYGAVSEATVEEMAMGALSRSNATYSVAVSGIAGPDGGSDEKPVGTVCFSWANKQGICQTHTVVFSGDRHCIRQQGIVHALTELVKII